MNAIPTPQNNNMMDMMKSLRIPTRVTNPAGAMWR